MSTEKSPEPKLKVELKELSVVINEENARRLGIADQLFNFVPDLLELSKLQEVQSVRKSLRKKGTEADFLSLSEEMDAKKLVRQIPPDIKVIRLKIENLIIEGD